MAFLMNNENVTTTTNLNLLSEYQKCFSFNKTWPSNEDKIFAAIPLLIITIIAFGMNLTLILTILKNFNELTDKIRINILLLNLCLSHCLYLSGTFFVQSPAAISSVPIYSNDSLMISLTSISSIGFYAIVFFEFSVAVDRFIVFYVDRKLSRKPYFIFISILWIFSISAVALQVFYGCPKRYNQWQLSYSFDCNKGCGSKIFNFIPISYLLNLGTNLTYVVFGLYVLVFLKIIHMKSLHQSKFKAQKRELFLLAQFFAIFLCTWLSSTSMFVFPEWFGRTLVTNVASMVLIAANALLDAILLIAFNSTLRRKVISMFKIQKLSGNSVIISISNNTNNNNNNSSIQRSVISVRNVNVY